jgi:hypothetical protein
MSNKTPIILVIIFFISSFLPAQTIVSTNPENKKVILEEYTGIHCTYCPDGHEIAQSLKDANPDNFFIINIHTGGYATPSSGEPDFRTSFGDAIAAQSNLTGYPSGSVNRQYFSSLSMNGGTAMGRGSWSSATSQVLNQSAYVNLGVEASINVQNNELTVHVEGYYTADSPESTNLLNIALLQNNTLGPQTGGGMGSNYNHMHRLVHMITGQWGFEISTTSSGSFVDETFTYTIPSDYNGVRIEVENISGTDGSMMELCFGECYFGVSTGTSYPTSPSMPNVNIEPGQTQPSSGDHFFNMDAGDGNTAVEYAFKFYLADENGIQDGNSFRLRYRYSQN